MKAKFYNDLTNFRTTQQTRLTKNKSLNLTQPKADDTGAILESRCCVQPQSSLEILTIPIKM